jgi:Fe-S cluster assembly protein SufB
VATPDTLTTPEPAENAALRGINSDYDERYGFHDAENYLYKAPKGINREIVEKSSSLNRSGCATSG